MKNSGRRFLSLSLIPLAFAMGCNESATPSAAPPKPVPKIHVDGGPPDAPVPHFPDVTPPAFPDDIITTTLAEKNFFKRAENLAKLLPTLGPDSVPAAVDALTRMDINIQTAEVVLLARFWAHFEPEKASTWAMNKAPVAYKSAVIIATVTEWARVDPYGAEDRITVARMLPGAELSVIEIALIRGWFYSKVEGVEDYVRGMGMGPNRQRALRTLIRASLDEYGPEHTTAWVEKFDDDDKKFRLAGFRQLAVELGSTHLEAAIAFCAKWCDDPVMGNGLRKHVAQQWALRDGRGAMEYMKSAPRNSESDVANKWAFRGWYASDREAFREWLAENGPEGVAEWMQSMLELVAIDLGKVDAHNGLAWAREIKDDEDRRRTVTTVLQNWRRRDREAADAWLDQTNLPADMVERVKYYGRPGEEIQADPNPGPGKIKSLRMRPTDTELGDHEYPGTE